MGKKSIGELIGEFRFDGNSSPLYENLRNVGLDASTGGAVFFAGLTAAQATQRGLRLSAASYPFSSIIGAAAVFTSSVLAISFASVPRRVLSELEPNGRLSRSPYSNLPPQYYYRFVHNQTVPESITIGIFGLGLFRLLGGRFFSIAPSEYRNLGAFHLQKASLPATESYASSSERAVINAFGKLFGCHTCGSKLSLRYDADHMPPKNFVKKARESWWRFFRIGAPVEQRFYPQCKPCSNQQGHIVKKNIRKLCVHFTSLRTYHSTGIWLVLLGTGALQTRKEPTSSSFWSYWKGENPQEEEPSSKKLFQTITSYLVVVMYSLFLDRLESREEYLLKQLSTDCGQEKEEFNEELSRIRSRKAYLKEEILKAKAA